VVHRLRETPEFGDATCVAIACPACMTLGLAQSCAGYVTTVINGTDMVPTMSLGAHAVGSSIWSEKSLEVAISPMLLVAAVTLRTHMTGPPHNS
jgi:hypothetical protein